MPGTQLYKRFKADNFDACMNKILDSKVLHDAVENDSLWTQEVTPFSLPPHLDLIMGDVCGGSSSVSMV